jgi:class 3 adenylate cyclase/tetratricopeptide (TPR) repeat protein
MPDLPRGTVTFLFTDIEGSTRLWEHDPAAMRAAVDRHIALLEEAVTAHLGFHFKTVGDAVQAAFPTAPAAVVAALAAQRAILAEDWGETSPLRVRMALHAGEAAPDARGDYLAPTLNRLSRLLSAGHGGQILLTQTVQQLIRGALPPEVGLRDLGEHRLRDLVEPERVFQLVHADLPSMFPPLTTVASPPTNLPQHSVPVPTTIIVGREPERSTLRRQLDAAFGGRGRLVLLGGEAGIGKTTLAKDLAADAETRGTCVLTGHCYDLTNTPPYGPWLDLVATYPTDPALPTLPAAFAGGTLAKVTDQAALFADVRRFLHELSIARPSLVLLEDLHWADPASLELLRSIAPHVSRWRIVLLVTYRIDELTRDHVFYQQLPALVREAEGVRIDLKRLESHDLLELVTSHYQLSSSDEARLVAYLEHHAEGNPLFATELLRAFEDESLLRETEGAWSLGELTAAVVPSFLRQVIDGRIARLGQDIRRLLEIAAVIGQDVPLVVWAQVAALDDEALLVLVEQAVATHLLTAERDGTRVRFVHALIREALYEGILPPRRRLWHREVAESLMAGPHPDPDAIAYHLQQSGDPRTWEWLVRAADRAQRAYAWLTATERLRAAAALLAGVEGQESTHRRIVSRLAYLMRFSDPVGAIEALDEADRLAARVGDEVLVAELQSTRGYLQCYSDQFRTGLAEIEEGLAALEAMPLEVAQIPAVVKVWLAETVPGTVPFDTTADEQAVVRLHKAGFHFRRCWHPWFLASAGHIREAMDIGERFVSALGEVTRTRGGIRTSTAFASHGLAIAYAAMGRVDEARQSWTLAREIFRGVDHHALVAFTLLNELRDVTLTYEAADPTTRRRLAAEAEAALGRAGGALRPGVSPRLAWLGCLILDGRWEEAERLLENVPGLGNAHLRREVTSAKAVLGRHRGEPERAWEQIRARFPEGPVTEAGDGIHQEGLFLQRLAVDLSLDAGDLAGSRTWLEAHDRWIAWSQSLLGQAEGSLSWARYHWVAGNTAAARAGIADTLALASTPDQPLVRLAAHRLLGEIETTTKHYAEAETHLTIAFSVSKSCAVPLEHVYTLLTLAQLRRAQGAISASVTLLEEARATCVALGAQPTLNRVEELLRDSELNFAR